MDLRLRASSPQLHYGVNGAGQNHRPGDETLQFLSQEEQECLQFFEKTIDSLEDSLEDQDQRRSIIRLASQVDGRLPPSSSSSSSSSSSTATASIVSSLLARHPTPKDQDIIDLVRPEPDLVQMKEPVFVPTSPDFQSMVPTPESHFEIKPRRDPGDNLPSDYNPPLPSGSYGPPDSHSSSYHPPPGCIPTPVVIAQKIAENQAGGSSTFNPSAILRRSSLESEKPDHLAKLGPPVSTRPSRYPSNINIVLGNKEQPGQSLPSVNIHERRAQMLANLTGTPHPLVQEDPQVDPEKQRNVPARSISFKDPSPDKSRMEALSKLGLTRNRAMSGGDALLSIPTTSTTPLEPLRAAEPREKPPEASVSSPAKDITVKLPEVSPHPTQIHMERKREVLRSDSQRSNEDKHNLPSPPLPTSTQTSSFPETTITNPRQSQIHVERKQEIPRRDSQRSNEDKNRSPMFNQSTPFLETNVTSPQQNQSERKQESPRRDPQRSTEDKNRFPSPPPSTHDQSSFFPPPPPPVDTLPPPEVASLEFNSYGGKSIVVNPSFSSKHEPPVSPTSPEPRTLPSTLAIGEFNTYGGKSIVVNPASPPSASMTRNQLPDILSSHKIKSQTLPARVQDQPPPELNSYGGKSLTINPSPAASPARVAAKAPAPTPAPRPARHSFQGLASHQKADQHALPADYKKRSNSLFRPQGITVQFSGRGATDESRREALRKLGLLKES